MMSIAIVAFVGLAVLSPFVAVVPGFPSLRGDDVVLLAVAVYGLTARRCRPVDMRDWAAKGFLFMGVLALVSIAGSVLFFSTPLVFNDFMFLVMLLKYFIVFRFGQHVVCPRHRSLVLLVLGCSLSLSAAVGIAQHHNLFEINSWLTPTYAGEAMRAISLDAVIAGADHARVAGTTADPRQFGYLLVVGVAVWIALMLENRRPFVRMAALAGSALCAIAIIYTLSRTAIFSAAMVIGVALWQLLRARTIGRALGVAVVSLLGVYLAVTFAGTQGFKERVLGLESRSYEMSLHARKRDLVTPFKEALANPLIFLVGRGPSKAVLRTSTHGDLGWCFHRFGLFGMTFYLVLILRNLRRAYSLQHRHPIGQERALLLLSLLVLVNWLVFALAENVFKSPQLMALNMFAAGLLWPAPRLVTSARGAAPVGARPCLPSSRSFPRLLLPTSHSGKRRHQFLEISRTTGRCCHKY